MSNKDIFHLELFLGEHPGKYIKYLLVQNNVSQYRLAHITGIDAAVISHIVAGHINLNVKRIKTLALALNIDPMQLFRLDAAYKIKTTPNPKLKVSTMHAEELL